MQLSSGARSLNFGMGLHSHQFFVYASSKGSDKTVHLHSLVRAFGAGIRNDIS